MLSGFFHYNPISQLKKKGTIEVMKFPAENKGTIEVIKYIF